MSRKIKWAVIVLALALCLIFGKMLPGEPLTERSVVVGFGIDSEGADKIKISAQILNPGGGQEQSGTETNVVTVTDSTIAGAMNKISEKSSHTVTLTHCNVVFIGKGIAEGNNIYSVINYLVSNSYLSENAFLFLTEDTAEEVLKSKTGFGDNASLYTQSIVGLYGDYSDIASKTLQCFISSYHSLGESNWLPVVKKEPTPPKMSDKASPSDETQYLFDLNTIAVFVKNEYKGEFSGDGTKAFNYIHSKIKKGAIDAVGDNGEKIVLYITGNGVKKKFDFETKTVRLEIELNTILKEIVDFGVDDSHIDRTEMSDSEIKRTEEKIKSDIEDFYDELRFENVDLFNFLESFSARYGKKAADLNIKDVSVDVNVTLSVDS